MAAPSQQKTSLANKWHRDFQKALELDGWGQVEEAKSGYETCRPPRAAPLFPKLSPVSFELFPTAWNAGRACP